ncbi:MAG: omptin family outer membrane protease [Spirochaetaceae bacterium]|jgi:outer membrane protease|nr:omptin family outer membrane protease [Spirochaetaceae bacterium]
MRKVFFGVLSVFLIPLLPAQEAAVNPRLAPDHPWSLGISTGVLFGQSEEIVYYDAKTSNKISQLLWDIKPLVYAGVDFRYNRFRPETSWGLFTDFSFKIGLPGKTGIMEDRDWTGQYTATGAHIPDWLTHYSVHDNTTENAFLGDAAVGLFFKIFGRFLVITYLSYDFMYFSWRASGGSFLYPEKDGGHKYYTQPIDVITYQQIWHIVSPGVAFYGAFNRYFTGEIALKASPFIWCITEDNHILRSLIITDILDLGLFIEPQVLFSFIPADFLTLSLAVSYRHISLVRGDSIYKEAGVSPIAYKNLAGVGYSVFDAGIVAKFSF